MTCFSIWFTSEVDRIRKYEPKCKVHLRWYDLKVANIAVGIVAGTALAVFVSLLFAFYDRFSESMLLLLFTAAIAYEAVSIQVTARCRFRFAGIGAFFTIGLTWIVLPVGGVALLLAHCFRI